MSEKRVEFGSSTQHEEKKEENPDDDFVWQDYLDSTNSKEVPQIFFNHVEQSLLSGFQEGMKVEVPVKDDFQNYWVATIITACGPLLSLRYVGDKDDRSKDFWYETTKSELRPIGWTESNGKILVPPSYLNGTISHRDLKSTLKGCRTISSDLINADGFTPIDRIKQGMKVEVQDKLHPYHTWIATIIENVGGRLLLRYDTPESTSDKDFWLFYSSSRVFPPGWTKNKGSPWKFFKPSCCKNSTYSDSEWEAILEMSKEDIRHLPTPDIFQKTENKDVIPYHNLSVGMRLEAIHPKNRAEICPAKIVRVFDSKYFLIAIEDATAESDRSAGDKNKESRSGDDSNNENIASDLTWLSNLLDPFILPCGWAKSHNLKLKCPPGWSSMNKDEFHWDKYLEMTKSKSATFKMYLNSNEALEDRFELGMKLEAVNPENERQICAATIVNITEHLLWIRLDSNDCFHLSAAFNLNSLEMFPVGWCEMNNYPLKPPKSYQPLSSQSSEIKSSQSSDNADYLTPPDSDTPVIKSDESGNEKQKDSSKSNNESRGSFWCPKIYFNHKCFSGPFLSKGKLAQLPKAVGPGPVTLVMKEVLSMIISVAYISSRVLRELQCKTKPTPGMHLEVLKAKYKSNAYRASVEIVTSADKVTEFCKDICQKLQVCPYLFGPIAVGEKSCPENCSTLSKTRFCKKTTVGSNNNNSSNTSSNSKDNKDKDTENSNSKNSSNSSFDYSTFTKVMVKKCVVPEVETNSTPTTRSSANNNNNNSNSSNKLYSWPPKRKRSLEKDYFSGFGKENDDYSGSGKRVRYETRGVKLPNFGLKKPNGSSVSIGSSNGNSNVNSSSSNNNNSSSNLNLSSITIKPQNHHFHQYPSPTNSECSSISSINENSSHQLPLKKKRGRHSKAKKEELRKAAEIACEARMDDSLYHIDSNPLLWTVEDVYDYLRSTDDCDVLANLLKEEEFDGKSFMLLNLPSCLDSLKLNLKTALSLCRHVEAVKYAFFCKYVIPTASTPVDVDS